jgi:hypothetical protein
MSRHKTPRVSARTWEFYSDAEWTEPVRADKPQDSQQEFALPRGRIVPRLRQQFHRHR